MAGELPDLTGMSARERRIFAMGASWGAAEAVEGVVDVMRRMAPREDIKPLAIETVLNSVADGFAEADTAALVRGLRKAGLLT